MLFSAICLLTVWPRCSSRKPRWRCQRPAYRRQGSRFPRSCRLSLLPDPEGWSRKRRPAVQSDASSTTGGSSTWLQDSARRRAPTPTPKDFDWDLTTSSIVESLKHLRVLRWSNCHLFLQVFVNLTQWWFKNKKSYHNKKFYFSTIVTQSYDDQIVIYFCKFLWT